MNDEMPRFDQPYSGEFTVNGDDMQSMIDEHAPGDTIAVALLNMLPGSGYGVALMLHPGLSTGDNLPLQRSIPVVMALSCINSVKDNISSEARAFLEEALISIDKAMIILTNESVEISGAHDA